MSKTDIVVQLTGKDGNVFNIIGIVQKALKKASRDDLAKEFVEKAFKAQSYNEVLQIIKEYVEIE